MRLDGVGTNYECYAELNHRNVMSEMHGVIKMNCLRVRDRSSTLERDKKKGVSKK